MFPFYWIFNKFKCFQLVVCGSDSDFLKSLKRKLKTSKEEYLNKFKIDVDDDVLKTATLLDPCFKELNWITNTQLKNTIHKDVASCINEIMGFAKTAGTESQTQIDESQMNFSQFTRSTQSRMSTQSSMNVPPSTSSNTISSTENFDDALYGTVSNRISNSSKSLFIYIFTLFWVSHLYIILSYYF